MIRQNLNKLSERDIYSLLLFALFQLKNEPKYSTLSLLVYLLDKESLLNLLGSCEGLEIKIPTMSELKSVIGALTLYSYVNCDNIDYNKALKLLDKTDTKLKDIELAYIDICKVLENYSFEDR